MFATLQDMLTYTLSSPLGLLTHVGSQPKLLRDSLEEQRYDLEVRIHSGDYFVSLATKLDAISRKLVENPVSIELDQLVDELLFIQTHYKVTKS